VGAPGEYLSRWPYRVDDLGPFNLVDAAATLDQARRRLAVTLVNRSEEPERAEVVLRRGSFAGTARVRCVTGTGRPSAVDGVEEADLDDATVSTRDAQVVVELPARSFTLVEAGLQGA
jgi:hypothetical protein